MGSCNRGWRRSWLFLGPVQFRIVQQCHSLLSFCLFSCLCPCYCRQEKTTRRAHVTTPPLRNKTSPFIVRCRLPAFGILHQRQQACDPLPSSPLVSLRLGIRSYSAQLCYCRSILTPASPASPARPLFVLSTLDLPLYGLVSILPACPPSPHSIYRTPHTMQKLTT